MSKEWPRVTMYLRANGRVNQNHAHNQQLNPEMQYLSLAEHAAIVEEERAEWEQERLHLRKCLRIALKFASSNGAFPGWAERECKHLLDFKRRDSAPTSADAGNEGGKETV